MINLLTPLLDSSKLLILGFGREGQSTYRFIHQNFPHLQVAIADRDKDLLSRCGEMPGIDSANLHLGENYLDALKDYNLIIKSPGVGLPEGLNLSPGAILTSQTRLMLQAYHNQIIGITGTKGKSTTSSLVHHLLQTSGIESVLVGNIGRPPFDYLNQIGPGTTIVYEMSSHQLEDVVQSPHIAVLLNLFPEHLDRYTSLESYYRAKMNILTRQMEQDIFIYNEDIPEIADRIRAVKGSRRFYTFSNGLQVRNGCYLSGDRIILSNDGSQSDFIEVTEDFQLKGRHNRMNMMAALLASQMAGANDEAIRQGLKTFKGLEHRLEYVGEHQGVHFYNDSIATIPEAAMAAVKSLPGTDTIILGGFDRMLDYTDLVSFMVQSQVMNFIFTGKAGERMLEIFRATSTEKRLIRADNLKQACEEAFQVTAKGKICLLSPAAASYDSFKNFEERGNLFKKIARGG
jgi:UDP-N-acetylmuramoylalanine--D-glutamate ligase